MSSILSLTARSDGRTGLHVDLGAFEALMKAALHRAAIFLGYAYHSSEIAPLASISLKAAIELDVGVPDPIAPTERKAYQAEFTSWSIGQGLIEIDQSYHRFVASALDTISQIDAFLATGVLPEKGKPNLANAWKVHEQFYAAVGQKATQQKEESECLRSLGNARNCLVHDSGLVTERRLTDGSTMPVRWIGRDMVLTTANGERRVLSRERPHRVRPEDVGLELQVQEVFREELYRAGDRITFSQTDLSEIIFFYQNLAMQVSVEMHRLVALRVGSATPPALE